MISYNNQKVLRLICQLISCEDKDRTELVQQLSHEPAREVWRCVKWHRLYGIFWEAIKTHSELLSAHQQQKYKKAAFDAAVLSIAQQGLLSTLSKVFSSNNIPLMVFKGVALSQLFYNDAASRHGKDIDIWVPPEKIGLAHELLLHQGFVLCSPANYPIDSQALVSYMKIHKDMVYLSQSSPVVELELHWRLDKNKFAYPFDFDEVHSNANRVHFSGTAIKTFSIEDYLIYLCTHGGLAFWGRLKWLMDWRMAVIKATDQSLDWSRFRARLVGGGNLQMALIAAHLSEHYFQQPAPVIFKNDRLSFAAKMAMRLVIRYATQTRYPPLAIRWLLRLFLIGRIRFKLEQFKIGLFLLVKRLSR